MNYPSRKNQLALAIATAISLASLSGCTTNDSKVASEEEEQSKQPQVAEVKASGQQINKEQIEIAEAAQLVKQASQAVTADSVTHPIKLAGKMKKDERFRAERKIQAMNQAIASSPGALPLVRMPSEQLDRENYAHFDDNAIKLVAESPVSTFSIDVDTGAYTNVRRILNQGKLPRRDAVRAEEFINYFNYDFAAPKTNETPFAVHSDMMKSPWSENSYLLQLGVKHGNLFIRNDRLPIWYFYWMYQAQ